MPRRVMFVDDSVSIRQMASFTLREAGFDVVEAQHGRDAIRALGGRPIDLVVTDVHMPEMDGLTLVRELRAMPTYRFTPILVLTTETSDAKKQEGRTAGATGWLVKPFNPQQLLQVIARVLP